MVKMAPTSSPPHLPGFLFLLFLLPPRIPLVTGGSVVGVSQAVQQLTQRFASLEVSLDSRLIRLTDTAAKGEAVMESMSSRLDKVDSLMEKVEELEARLSTETSTLHSTITATTTHLQGMTTRLERLDALVREGGGGRGERQRGREGDAERRRDWEEEGGRQEIRSSWNPSGPDAQILSALVSRSVEEAVESALGHTLATFHNTLYKRLNKSVGELQEAVTEAREGLEDLGTRTLATATEARQDIRQGGKTTQEAVRNISNKIHSVHQDLALKISSPSLLSLGPVLRQVNHSVVETIARATQELNASSFLNQEIRRGGRGAPTGRGDQGSLQDSHAHAHCPDPTTVAALLQVRELLQTLLKKSEDLRRGLTKQTNEGVDLLKLLHQRFSVLLRRMNTDPDHGQMLVSEMQDLGSLVEASYMTVLVAQNAFIDSCKRIQDEEPMLELKMTEILDKLVTNIDLGYQHNRQQLSELKEVVQRLGEGATPITLPTRVDDHDDQVREDEGYDSSTTSTLPPGMAQVRDIIVEAVDQTNTTVEGLERLEARVEEVATQLLTTDWSDLRQKEPADHLVTAAKDLKGYTQEQILRSLDLHEALVAVLEHLDTTTTTTTTATSPTNTSATQHLQLRTSASTTLTLPASCTAVLVNHFRGLSQSSASPSPTPSTPTQEGEEEEEEVEEEEEEEEEGDEEEEEEEDDVPAWYTDPNFLSGNYGTPDLEFPVFREDEWMDLAESYALEDAPTTPRTPSPPAPTHAPRSRPHPHIHTHTASRQPHLPATARAPAPRGVDRFFGVKINPTPASQQSTSSNSRNP